MLLSILCLILLFHKLGKGSGDLIETDMMLKDFGGNASKTRGQ